ncbi:type II secretion system F family protein [Synechococcus elongatus IITB7]|uniref:type II secretion system F family protein n=1 Tax=Synechococcus elongatus TaxID=32046 RepID=UPI0030CB2302
MPTFVAQVRDSHGAIRELRIRSGNVRQARVELRQMGLVIQTIDESVGFSLANLSSFNLEEATSKVTVKDMALFSRQLSSLVDAGVPIVRALGLLTEQTRNPKLRKALRQINLDVQEGLNLSDSMRKFPNIFDGLYVAMIQAGETGGVLDDVLNRLSKLLEDMSRLRNQMKSAMTYPMAVFVIAILVFLGMTIFIIPTFAGIFEDQGAELPGFTLFLLSISETLRTPIFWGLFLVFLFGSTFVFKQYYATPLGCLSVDSMILRLPILGEMIQKAATARFCRTFGSLTRAGVPIMTALEIVRDTAGNQAIAQSIDAARMEVQTGGMMSVALARYRIFPMMALSMITIGEETGELDTMVNKVADFYEDEVEQAVKGLTSLLEPIMIVLVGGIVGSILLAMYLPMFSIFDQIKG